jgi:glutathione synthase/RimK-type ligase-like ATP-grasp enzyme
LRGVRTVWWRRPQPFELGGELVRPSYRAFAYNECHEAWSGLWETLDAFWVNHPPKDEAAARKAYQLDVARSAGLAIPSTLITNDPEEARRFVEDHRSRGVIYKAFSATEQAWRETRLLREAEEGLLEQVRHAPVIFQEYIPAGVVLRVTIVGDAMFAAAIHSQETSYRFDFRIDMNAARVLPFELPGDAREGLSRLIRCLGLQYGAVDMRQTPDGEIVFLEINPAGQWLFIEDRTRQPITKHDGATPRGTRPALATRARSHTR